MMKLRLKISGTFRSKFGADMFCRIRGFIATAKKQNINVLDAICSVSTYFTELFSENFTRI
jgi:transposase